MSKTHEILILGGHFAGLGMAHYLLRHTIPVLEKASPSSKYHVTIVAPHSEFFFDIAAPRFLVGKDLIPADKIFIPISQGLREYGADRYSLVQGKAVSMSAEKKVVTVGLQGGVSQELSYDTLIIATGTTSNSALWQMNDKEDLTKSLYASVQASLAKAKRVLIGGGGAVGVETAGEIGNSYPAINLTILSGADRLLPRLSTGNSKKAEGKLAKMGVSVVHKLRVTSSKEEANGTTTVVLSDGSTREVDLYIDATGGKPNSSFLPAAWLNEKGYVVVSDEKTLRTSTPGVYAIGDVASYSSGSFMDVNFSVPPLGTSISIDLAEKIGKKDLFTQKLFKPLKDSQFVPIGPKGGVAQVMGWSLPSFFVWLIKARTFFIEKAEPTVKGADYVKP
ncbi:hypothetical protein BP6252_05607 [Coleophoma cylindrospora]|uniref:FAD/NAD(P)-binding domain-containing protein n=1 Tax=Coleophoma cylindrospora TaxID=1849047 RepID=A0A3D8RUM0_9HELO|nr:hypothetical protein BP6252_05607 [Coleophoma cylindrospora]